MGDETCDKSGRGKKRHYSFAARAVPTQKQQIERASKRSSMIINFSLHILSGASCEAGTGRSDRIEQGQRGRCQPKKCGYSNNKAFPNHHRWADMGGNGWFSIAIPTFQLITGDDVNKAMTNFHQGAKLRSRLNLTCATWAMPTKIQHITLGFQQNDDQ